RRDAGAGSSWGNAGWFTPELSVPLPSPEVLKYGIRTLFRSDSPVHVPWRLSSDLARFLYRFTRNCTAHRWQAALEKLTVLNDRALTALQRLESALPPDARSRESNPFVAAF